MLHKLKTPGKNPFIINEWAGAGLKMNHNFENRKHLLRKLRIVVKVWRWIFQQFIIIRMRKTFLKQRSMTKFSTVCVWYTLKNKITQTEIYFYLFCLIHSIHTHKLFTSDNNIITTQNNEWLTSTIRAFAMVITHCQLLIHFKSFNTWTLLYKYIIF